MKRSDKQTAILDATLALVAERGFHGAPTSAIAQEAGVGVGTIYRYFENKEELIAELYRALRVRTAEAMLAGYSADLPLRERFRRIWINTARYYLDHPLQASFVEQYNNLPYLEPETDDPYAGYSPAVLEFLERGVYEGVLKELPLELFASLTLEVAISLAKKHRAGAIVLTDALLEQAMDACWDAVKR
jgi:AcrR family transcriptional regulator